MKKIVGIVLGILVLAMGLIGCASCKPEEPDPHEALYGVYKLITNNDNGVQVRTNGNRMDTGTWPQEVQDKIDEVLAIAGDTITITKDKVSFSGGNKQPEYEYRFAYWDTIYFEDVDIYNRNFPFYRVEIEDFKNYTVFQLVTGSYTHVGEDEDLYEIYLYYYEYSKF